MSKASSFSRMEEDANGEGIMEGLNCPTCSTLVDPVFASAHVGKMFYLDSRYFVICDGCGLKISTNAYRRWMAEKEEE